MRAFGGRFIALVCALGVLAALITAARAGPYEDGLRRFSADSFDDTIEGINAVATSGNALAAQVIGALQEGRLLFSAAEKRVFIREGPDQLIDAETGRPVASGVPSDLAPVRLNNRLRRIVEAALGSLTLMAPDPGKRLEAAQAVLKSKDANALPALEKAIAGESDPRVKQALNEARAAVVLYLDNAPDADKIDAIAVIRQRGDQDALALLGGLPASASPTVKRAAADAIASIENSLALWTALQNAWYGLSLGSVLLLAAIGLAITFGVMGVINMAHGEMVMLGAYTTFVVQQVIRARNPALFDYSLAIAIPLAFAVAGVIGILVERGIIRFLYGRPLETLLATWGLSLVLQQGVRTVFGPTNKDVGNPSWMSGSFDFGQMTITYNRLWIIVFTLLIFMGLLAILRFTRFGLEMRAVTQNRAMAASMGIRTSRIDALTGLHHRFIHGGGVRRRGQSLGHLGRRVHPRHRQQVSRALCRRRARQDRHPGAHHPVHPEAPARAVRLEGPGGGSMIGHLVLRSLDRGAIAFLATLAAIAVLVPVLNLALPPTSPFYLSSYFVALFGKYVCLALLALSIDLIWGYCGILSLGHGAFFALGGYAMGMYLMRQIGTRGVYALPVYWYGFQHFAYAAFMVVLVPGLLAFVFGWFAFRSRVTGVYLSIITQALTFALMLGFIICRVAVSSKFGKVLVAIRDAEARTRFLGYRVEAYKVFVFTLSACMAGVAGALYVPQVGIINPSEFSPGNSIEAVIWVAVGGRGTLTGAVLGAVLVNYGKTYFTSGVLAPYWLFVLGGLFIAVTLLLPRGVVGTIHYHWREWRERRRLTAPVPNAAPRPAE